MAEEIDYAGLMDLIRDSDVFSEVDHSTIKNRIASSLLSDPIIKESFVKSEIANAMKKLSELKTRKKFFVQDVLTPEQQRLLRNRHPDFDLDFSKAKFTLSHPFQRSQRKMFQEKCLFELKVKDISKPSKGYDVVIKDVGANPAIHIGDDRFHSCCPLLSTCDDRRRSAYLLQLQQFVPDQKTKRAYDAHCAGDSRVICQRKAQNCHIKAPILLFNHSAYDMTPSDIAAAMYSSGATVGKGVIHFHPMVFYETSGVFPHGMHFRRFRNSSGTEKIRFFFENDNQRGYGHDYANYLRLVRMFVITHKTDRTHYFNVEFEGQNNDDCMYFTIYACRNGVVPRSTEFRVITDETLRDKVVLYYWQWRTLNPGTFLNFVKDKIRPKRLIVPRKLYELLYSYTATLTDQKLTVKNIIRAAQAFNTREIISGQSVKVPDPISPENLIHVSHAVFLLVYIKNYECSQVLSKLIEQETYVRTKSSSNFVSRFISNRVLAFTEKFRPSARHEAILKTVVPSDDCCATTEGYKSLFQYFKIDGVDDSMLEIKRQFNVVVQEKSVHFVTIEDEIENLCAANDPHMRGFTNPSAFENLDPQLIRSVINEHLPLEEPATNLLDVDAFVTSACAASGSFREISNDSNGDCAFQSAIDLGLYDQTPFELRRKLLQSKHIESIRDPDKLRLQLETIDGSPTGYSDKLTFILIALEFDICVCIHEADTCSRYGTGRVFHFQFADGHCQALKHIDGLLPLKCLKSVDVKGIPEKPHSIIPDFDNYFEKPAKISQDKHRQFLNQARINYYFLSCLGSGNYVSRSGMKTAEIVTRFIGDERIESAFTVGGPGGEAQYLMERHYAEVCGITLQTGPAFSPIVKERNLFTEILDPDGLGDILEGKVSDYAAEELLRLHPAGVDFFGGDAAPNVDYVNHDQELCANLFFAQVTLAAVAVKEGGFAYFKVFSLSDEKSVRALTFLRHCFESVYFVKLHTTRPASSEFHVICKNLLPSHVALYADLIYEDVPLKEHFEFAYAVEEHFNAIALKGLKTLKKCYNTVDTNAPVHYVCAPETHEAYKNLLCIEPTPVGMFSVVKNIVAHIFTGDEEDEDTPQMILTIRERMRARNVILRPTAPVEDLIDIHTDYDSDTDDDTFVSVAEVPSDADEAFEDRSPPKYASIIRQDVDIPITLLHQHTKTNVVPLKLFEIPSIPCQAASVPLPKTERPVETVETAVGAVKLDSVVQKAMHEFLELTNLTFTSQLSNHARISDMMTHTLPSENFLRSQEGEYGLVRSDGHGKIRFLIKPAGKTRESNELITVNKIYNKCFYNGTFHTWDSLKNIAVDALVSEYTSIAIEREIIESLTRVDIEEFTLPEDTSIVQAVPGAGKTTHIVEHCNPPDHANPTTVLLATREGKHDFVARLMKKHPGLEERDCIPYIRTVKSYIVNTHKNKPCQTLYIDEALMSHPGELFFAIALSGAKTVRMLGDILQIPYVNRTPDYRTKYHILQDIVPVSDFLCKTYRCPPDVAARLDSAYLDSNRKFGGDTGMVSNVNKFQNTCSFTRINNNNFLIDQQAKYLTFTQWEKDYIKTNHPALDVSTVHEFQGKESNDVIVVRLDYFENSEIYKRFNYALVALTRHKTSLRYFTRVATDALARLIQVDGVLVTDFPKERIMRSYSGTRVGARINEILVNRDPAEFSTLRTTSRNIWSTDATKLFFVPRIGLAKAVRKPYVMDRRVVVTKHGDRDVITAIGRENPGTKFTLSNIKASLATLRTLDVLVRRTDVYVESSILDDIDHSVLASVFHKAFPFSTFYFCTERKLDAPSEVFDLLNTNALVAFDNKVLQYENVELTCVPYHKLNTPLKFVIDEAQRFVNNIFSASSFTDQTLDEWMIVNSDLDLELGDVKFNPITAPFVEKKYDSMIPVLKTTMPIERNYHLRELMLALYKRNRNVPRYDSVVDYNSVSQTMLDNLIEKCFCKRKLAMNNVEPILVGPGAICDWLTNQDTSTLPLIVPEFAIHCSAVNSYNFSIKRQAKPVLTLDATASYTALQTIVYHEKPINAIFCAIFREIKTRVLNSLRRNVKIFSDMSPTEFEECLNEDIPVSTIQKFIEKLEIDISKYDKSQGELALEFECKLMRFMKVDEYFIRLWYHAHILSTIYDKTTKLSALIPYQRKSGDASTFIGNTLFLMAVIADLIPVDEMSMALFSGDDSLLYGFDLEQYKDTQHFGLKFNLEIKFFSFEQSYFCSKFLLPVEGRWTFTPCPVKLMTRMGRSNIINRAHLEEYRISTVDNCKNFSDSSICAALAVAVRERYGITHDYSNFFRSIPDMSTVENFHSLFFEPDGEMSPNQFSNRFD